MKKDYRTWWRKELEYWIWFEGKYQTDLLFVSTYDTTVNGLDCVAEQLWAIKEGLA